MLSGIRDSFLDDKLPVPELILVARNPQGPFVVIEGNHRLVVYFYLLQNNKLDWLMKKGYLGVSNNLPGNLFVDKN